MVQPFLLRLWTLGSGLWAIDSGLWTLDSGLQALGYIHLVTVTDNLKLYFKL
jgi:hypothetical protein